MSARRRAHGGVDAVVAGGGVVGAACALALAQQGREVVLVEPRRPAAWSPDRPDLRVYAIAPDAAALLDRLGAWPAIRDARSRAYRAMRVWDAAGGDALVFDADTLGRPALGWIIEHGLVVDALWRLLEPGGVRVRTPAQVTGCTQGDDGVRVLLDDGSAIDARLAIAADGAASPLREAAGIAVSGRNYGQRGVVAYVATGDAMQETAWQRFLPSGPLALLPCADLDGVPPGHAASIVWTLPADDAAHVLALDDEAFGHALSRAFDRRLGALRPVSERVAFPLRRQLAATQCSGRVLVVGDAAHVVHPLAGQGVNLGLRDVAALADAVAASRAAGRAWDAPARLARWARARRSDNAASAHAFDLIERGFSNTHPLATLVRGRLLGLAGRMPPLTRALWRQAAGDGAMPARAD
jgi:2-octaprenyl-3-methyl-6-methoxy-1,4-benzoquinol hydroxylase